MGPRLSSKLQKVFALKTKFPNVPIMALTATANKRAQKDIMGCFHDESNTTFLVQSFNRKNLYYEVLTKPKNVKEELAAFIKNIQEPDRYHLLSLQKDCESVTSSLLENGVNAAFITPIWTPNLERLFKEIGNLVE